MNIPYDARTKAQQRLNGYNVSLKKARAIVQEAKNALQDLEADAALATQAEAESLAELIEADRAPASKSFTSILDGDINNARIDLNIKVMALNSLIRTHQQCDQELAQAERNVVVAVDAMLNQERETLAISINSDFDRLLIKIAELRTMTPDELHRPVNLTMNLSANVTKALSLAPPPDALHIPVNELRYGTPANRDAWAERRAQLIAGPSHELQVA
jgi:hypothetical protein